LQGSLHGPNFAALRPRNAEAARWAGASPSERAVCKRNLVPPAPSDLIACSRRGSIVVCLGFRLCERGVRPIRSEAGASVAAKKKAGASRLSSAAGWKIPAGSGCCSRPSFPRHVGGGLAAGLGQLRKAIPTIARRPARQSGRPADTDSGAAGRGLVRGPPRFRPVRRTKELDILRRPGRPWAGHWPVKGRPDGYRRVLRTGYLRWPRAPTLARRLGGVDPRANHSGFQGFPAFGPAGIISAGFETAVSKILKATAGQPNSVQSPRQGTRAPAFPERGRLARLGRFPGRAPRPIPERTLNCRVGREKLRRRPCGPSLKAPFSVWARSRTNFLRGRVRGSGQYPPQITAETRLPMVPFAAAAWRRGGAGLLGANLERRRSE